MINYIKYSAIFVVVVYMVFLLDTIHNLKMDIKVKEETIGKLELSVKLQNQLILSNKNDYDAKIKVLPKELIKIHTKYQVIYKNISENIGDTNASCEDTINKFNNTDL